MDDELVDEVFEDCNLFNPKHFHQNTNTGLNMNEATFLDEQTPSPITTLHPGFKQRSSVEEPGVDDGWRSYKIDDEHTFNNAITHKASYNT